MRIPVKWSRKTEIIVLALIAAGFVAAFFISGGMSVLWFIVELIGIAITTFIVNYFFKR